MKASPKLVAALLADPSTAECPQCGGTGFYDNRDSGKKGPAFKCKNKQCDPDGGYAFGVFARDLPAEAKNGAKSGGTAAPRATWAQIKAGYRECAKEALLVVKGVQKDTNSTQPARTEDVLTATATLFIQRAMAGAWPVIEKPKPVAPPPPKPEPEFEDYGDAEPEESLPF